MQRLNTVPSGSSPGRRGCVGWVTLARVPSHLMAIQCLFVWIRALKWMRDGLENRWADMEQEDVELNGLADDLYQVSGRVMGG